ncbi:hypothetical protein [Corynebacterium deserti]|nr:hypothetical protein [Corynebacterium deserti]
MKARPELLHRDGTEQTAWHTFAGIVPSEDAQWLRTVVGCALA